MIDIHPKLWGYEEWIVNRPEYCGKRLVLHRGWQGSLHYHKVKDETFYVEHGRVRLEVGTIIKELGPGDSQHIPKLTEHRFCGLLDSVIFEFSTLHCDDDTYRLEPAKVMDLGVTYATGDA